jgi:hypothetical protein
MIYSGSGADRLTWESGGRVGLFKNKTKWLSFGGKGTVREVCARRNGRILKVLAKCEEGMKGDI